MHIIGHERCSI